jgi:hypothetical protein
LFGLGSTSLGVKSEGIVDAATGSRIPGLRLKRGLQGRKGCAFNAPGDVSGRVFVKLVLRHWKKY